MGVPVSLGHDNQSFWDNSAAPITHSPCRRRFALDDLGFRTINYSHGSVHRYCGWCWWFGAVSGSCTNFLLVVQFQIKQIPNQPCQTSRFGLVRFRFIDLYIFDSFIHDSGFLCPASSIQKDTGV